MDRPSGNGQTFRWWTDLQAMDRPSGNGQTFRWRTDLQATDRPSGNGQTFRQWTDQATDRPSGNGQSFRRWTDLQVMDRYEKHLVIPRKLPTIEKVSQFEEHIPNLRRCHEFPRKLPEVEKLLEMDLLMDRLWKPAEVQGQGTRSNGSSTQWDCWPR
jgi:hypothetical protein